MQWCGEQVVNDLYTYVEPRSAKPAPLISEEVYQFIMKHKEQLNSAIVYDRDYSYDYFGFKTMEVRVLSCLVRLPLSCSGDSLLSCHHTTALLFAAIERQNCGTPSAHAHGML